MLKQYPMLRYVLQKAFWYLLTFVVAVAINFTLPRMGENNPVDIIMGKAAQGLTPDQAKLKKEALLKAFGMAELDDQGNVVYEPEVDENGQVKTVKVPKLDEKGQPVFRVVKDVDAEGNPVMVERQKVDEQGNPVFEEKPVLDAKGKPVMEKDPKTKKKVAKVEQIAVMEQVQTEHQDTVMVDQVVLKTDPRFFAMQPHTTTFTSGFFRFRYLSLLMLAMAVSSAFSRTLQVFTMMKSASSWLLVSTQPLMSSSWAIIAESYSFIWQP